MYLASGAAACIVFSGLDFLSREDPNTVNRPQLVLTLRSG